MFLTDGLALHASTEGLYPDQWLGGCASVRLQLSEDFDDVRLTLWIPEAFASREVTATCKGLVSVAKLMPGREVEVSLAGGFKGMRHQTELAFTDAFQAEGDGRTLGAILVAVRGSEGIRI